MVPIMLNLTTFCCLVTVNSAFPQMMCQAFIFDGAHGHHDFGPVLTEVMCESACSAPTKQRLKCVSHADPNARGDYILWLHEEALPAPDQPFCALLSIFQVSHKLLPCFDIAWLTKKFEADLQTDHRQGCTNVAGIASRPGKRHAFATRQVRIPIGLLPSWWLPVCSP